MEKLLLTGFEPFKKETINPSGILAKKMHGKNIGGKKVISSVFPVTFACGETIAQEIEDIDPVYVIGLGLASGRPQINLERIAVNIFSEGTTTKKIVADGPDAYFSLLPLEDILGELHKNKVPARISHSAGTYFCNYLLYRTLHHGAYRETPLKAGFIHLPCIPEQVLKRNLPSMSLAMMEEAVEIAIRKV
jgi:pyroglutamyl-peptidase